MLARIATLHEIEMFWALNDLADAHEALDIKQEAEAKAAEKIGHR